MKNSIFHKVPGLAPAVFSGCSSRRCFWLCFVLGQMHQSKCHFANLNMGVGVGSEAVSANSRSSPSCCCFGFRPRHSDMNTLRGFSGAGFRMPASWAGNLLSVQQALPSLALPSLAPLLGSLRIWEKNIHLRNRLYILIPKGGSMLSFF